MITLKAEGKCYKCGGVASAPITIYSDKKLRYKEIEKAMEKIMCDKCYMEKKFGISPETLESSE